MVYALIVSAVNYQKHAVVLLLPLNFLQVASLETSKDMPTAL